MYKTSFFQLTFKDLLAFMQFLRIFALCFVVLISGCTSMRELDTSSTGPSESESIFVLGVAPKNYRISIYPGSISDGHFKSSIVRSATFVDVPKQGFIVGKANGGDIIGITMVRALSAGSSNFGSDFKPCGDLKTMVFEVPKGKILYLGSVKYKFNGPMLEIQYRNEMEQAQRYMERNYPLLKGKLEPLEYKLLPTLESCAATYRVRNIGQ